MSNELVNTNNNVFSFQDHSVRVEMIDGEPWFVAKDICDILGYSNGRDALAKHCKEAGVAKRDIRSGGQLRSVAFINEPNLYRLIIKSRKPEAEKFEDWVMSEVLPSIRKTGSYSIAPRLNPEQYEIVDMHKLYTVSDVAKAIGLNPRDLFAYLNEKKWIFKRGKNTEWTAMQSAIQKGYMKNQFFDYFNSKGEVCSSITAKLTRSGIIRLKSMLKAEVDLLQ